MKGINTNEVKEVAKLLSTLKYDTFSDKSRLFFPIDASYEKDLDGFQLSSRTSRVPGGSKNPLTPGLILINCGDGKADVKLAYADLTYSPSFDMIQHSEILGHSLSKKLKEVLSETETYIVLNDYVSLVFNL